MLKTAVEAIAAPRREYLREHNEVPTDHVNRLGMAFADLAEHLPTEELPSAGGVGATLTVNVDLDTLIKGTRAATLSTGTRLSVAAVRQLACRVGVLPIILDGKPLPLDLGEEKRTFNRAQRRAMAKRDGGCTFPGCDRPPQWAEAHHITPWSEGGTTNLEDGCLVCPFHHRVIHADGWQLRISPDEGHIEYQSPGTSAWIRNHRYRANEPAVPQP